MESLSWEINIKKVENGFICSWKEEGAEEYLILNKQKVFEEKDEMSQEGTEELRNMEKLLNFLTEHFGIYYNKHSKSNLVIKIEGGELK